MKKINFRLSKLIVCCLYIIFPYSSSSGKENSIAPIYLLNVAVNQIIAAGSSNIYPLDFIHSKATEEFIQLGFAYFHNQNEGGSDKYNLQNRKSLEKKVLKNTQKLFKTKRKLFEVITKEEINKEIAKIKRDIKAENNSYRANIKILSKQKKEIEQTLVNNNLKRSEKIDAYQNLLDINIEIADHFEDVNNISKAIQYTFKGLETINRLRSIQENRDEEILIKGHIPAKAFLYLYLGYLFSEKKKFQKADYYYIKAAIVIFKNSSIRVGVGSYICNKLIRSANKNIIEYEKIKLNQL